MKRPHILFVAALLASAPVFAQNLNPTIVVTNTYEGSAAGISKPAQLLQVPDSVMKFNLDFDYAVFPNPYRGAYEFHPYLVSMKPRAAAPDDSRLYLRAGAGYTLRPEAEVVWSPKIGHGMALGVHGNFDSYFGHYRLIDPKLVEKVRSFDPSGQLSSGMDIRGEVGTDWTYAAGWGLIGTSLSYLNRTERDPLPAASQALSSFHQLGCSVFAESYNRLMPGWTWNGALDYRYGMDMLTAFRPQEHLLSFLGGAGRILDNGNQTRVDAEVRLARVGYGSFSTGGLFSMTPRYLLRVGDRLSLDLGVLFSAHLRENEGVTGREYFYETGSQIVYPAIHARYALWEDRITAYADITGGSRMNTYASQLEEHRFYRWNAMAAGSVPLDFSVERLRAAIGLRGQIAERLQLDLSGGYAIRANALLDANPYNNDELPLLGYDDYNAAFAALSYAWKSRSVSVDGSFQYCYCMMKTDRVFAPSPLSGDLRAMYDWKGRIRGGLTADFSLAREAVYDEYSTLRIPGFVDLGLQGEFRLTSCLGFWLRAGNLLNQTIQRHPLYAEDGVSVLGGITLNFR